eukprot:g8268.t1
MPHFALLAEATFLPTKRKLKLEADSVDDLANAVQASLRLSHGVNIEVFDKDFEEYVPLTELDQLEGKKGKVKLLRADTAAANGAANGTAAHAAAKASAPVRAPAPAPAPASAPKPAPAPALASVSTYGAADGAAAHAPTVAVAEAPAPGSSGGPQEVHVVIVMAKDLQDVQSFSQQDPYVKITLLPMGKTGSEKNRAKYVAQTKAVQGGGVCPHWDDPLEYNTKVSLPLAPGAIAVSVEVWNENAITDDIIGSAQIKLPVGSKAQAAPRWVDLRPCGQLFCTVYEGDPAQCVEHVREDEVSLWDRIMG